MTAAEVARLRDYVNEGFMEAFIASLANRIEYEVSTEGCVLNDRPTEAVTTFGTYSITLCPSTFGQDEFPLAWTVTHEMMHAIPGSFRGAHAGDVLECDGTLCRGEADDRFLARMHVLGAVGNADNYAFAASLTGSF